MDQQTIQSNDRLSDLADSPPQNSPLISRLARRVMAPVGVIDTHHPQYLHARVSNRAEDRLGWAERLRGRYLGEESEPSGHGLIYAGAQEAPPDGGDGTGSAGSARSNGLLIARQAAPEAPQGSVPAAPVSRTADSSLSLARVSRRGSHKPPNASLVQRKAEEDNEPRSSVGASASGLGGQFLGDEKISTSSSSSSLPAPGLKAGPVVTVGEARAPQVNFAGLPASGRSSSVPSLALPQAVKTGAATGVQRQVAERPRNGKTAPAAAEPAARLIASSLPVAGPVEIGPAVARSVVAPSAVARSEGSASPPPDLRQAAANRGVEVAAGSAMPQSGSDAVPGRMQETAAARSSSPPAQLIQRRLADRSVDQPAPVPALEPAMRLPAGDAPKFPPTIWRKTESGNEPGFSISRSPLLRTARGAAPQVIARQIERDDFALESGATIRATAFQPGLRQAAANRGVEVAAGSAMPQSGSDAVPGRMQETAAARSFLPPARLIQRRLADRSVDQPAPVPALEPAMRLPAGAAPKFPPMIWRKTESGNEPGFSIGRSPLLQTARGAAPQMIARQIERDDFTLESGATIRTAALTPPLPAQRPELNLARLAEQVSRILARQFEAERERRGIKR